MSPVWHVLAVVLAVAALVFTLAVLVQVVGMAARRRIAATRRAEVAHADYVLIRARRMAVEGVAELEQEADRIIDQGERDGRYGYGALLVTWREVADTLPREVVDVLEGRQAGGGGPYGRTIIYHLNGTTTEKL